MEQLKHGIMDTSQKMFKRLQITNQGNKTSNQSKTLVS